MLATQPSSTQENRFNLAQIYTADPRPTIIIDITRPSDTQGVRLEFANDAFTKNYGVLLRFIISGSILEPEFIEWLRSPYPSRNELDLGDLTWSFFILENRWKVVNTRAAHSPRHESNLDLSAQHTVSASFEKYLDFPAPQHVSVMEKTDFKPGSVGSGLVVALPSGLVSLGNAPTALEGLHRSVDMLDVGFFEYDLEGTLIFANKSWYTLSGHPYDPMGHTQRRFLDLCHPEDVTSVSKAWDQLLQGKSATFEMRWRNTSSPTAQALGAQWVLSACIPLCDENGVIRSITGCTTDINNQKLSEKIAKDRALATERARAFEQRFVRFAKVAPIVVFTLDANSKMTYCNDRWFEWTSTISKTFEEIDITEGFADNDSQKLPALINQAILNHDVNSISIRTNKIWHASNGRRAQAWVLASVFAEFTDDGEYLGCTGTLTDISELKYAEVLQKMQLDDALEAKRSQENFMDTTSHEIRNPLSAMVQCTDFVTMAVSDVASLIRSCEKQNGVYTVNESTIHQMLEHSDLASDSLNTIQSCCSHMQSIVNDVLTLSKLDSNLVSITPVKAQPQVVMQDVIKLFEMEARKSNVTLISQLDDSVEELRIQYLMFDPSRVKQILLNLVSNAIKFTRTEPVRMVTVRMSTTHQAPNTCPAGIVRYAPTLRSVPDGLLDEAQWGDGDTIYLQFTILDTGCGMTSRERAKLFHRFSQASPKTHVVYGGSGLGLFITRQLTELQGGEIGVSSEQGKGSIFSFYVQTRQTTPPESIEQTPTPLSPIETPPIEAAQETVTSTTAVSVTDKGITKGSRIRSMQQSVSSLAWCPVVLVVEDNIVNQKVLSAQLKRLGCRTLVAGNGVEALDIIKNTNLWQDMGVDNETQRDTLDIVLMDIEMPVMGGLECTSTIRRYEQEGKIASAAPRLHHRLPIISISANARAEQGLEQKEAGVDDIVIKPFRIPQLMDKIWNLVGKELRPPEERSGKGLGSSASVPSPTSA